MKKLRTPTLNKIAAVSNESRIIGQFLDWLAENDCEIASYDGVALKSANTKLAAALAEPLLDRDLLVPVNLSTEKILALYFKIDLDKAERERMTLLARVRAAQRRTR